MIDKIDFENEVPFFIFDNFKWYEAKILNNYIRNKQAENLPKLNGFGCFVVKSDTFEDLVLIDNKQNIIDSHSFDINGYEQMIAKINIIKISKNYDKH